MIEQTHVAEKQLLTAFDRVTEAIGAYLNAIRHRSLCTDSSAELLAISLASGLGAQELIDVECGEMNISGEGMSKLPGQYQPFSKLSMSMLLGVFTLLCILRNQLRRVVDGESLDELGFDVQFSAAPSDDPKELN